MRHRFESQIGLDQTPIEKVVIPLKSRDELPPILAGLQWIFNNNEVNQEIFELLEKKVIGDKKQTGRPGMDLWHILVLGVSRLGLDCDYDRLEHLANYDYLMRQIMGLEPIDRGGKSFTHKSLCQNVNHLDEEMLQQVNAIVLKHGRKEFKKNEQDVEAPAIEAKVDSYVLETNVHFPTDLNLLWDCARKCLDVLESFTEQLGLSGWRKSKNWRTQIKGQMRSCSRVSANGGKNKAQRLKKVVRQYVSAANKLSAKVKTSIQELKTLVSTSIQVLQLQDLEEYQRLLDKHIDLVERRLIKEETIPHEEKLFSIFEPHTEWIVKGKSRPAVELGHRLLITTDQFELVLDYKVVEQSTDVEQAIPLAQRLREQYGQAQFKSISFDKGFSSENNRKELEQIFPELIMPKKGRLNQEDQERENQRRFKELKNQHSAVESDINCLEHHGLNRCPDKGIDGYKRYVGLGILAYNLHKIGARLLAKQRQGQERVKRKSVA